MFLHNNDHLSLRREFYFKKLKCVISAALADGTAKKKGIFLPNKHSPAPKPMPLAKPVLLGLVKMLK